MFTRSSMTLIPFDCLARTHDEYLREERQKRSYCFCKMFYIVSGHMEWSAVRYCKGVNRKLTEYCTNRYVEQYVNCGSMKMIFMSGMCRLFSFTRLIFCRANIVGFRLLLPAGCLYNKHVDVNESVQATVRNNTI